MIKFDLKYGFKIEVILRKRAALILIKNETFTKSFILKGFSEDYAHYLPTKMKAGGSRDGLKPRKVAATVRSVELGPVLYPEIERQLLGVQLEHPRGDLNIWRKNNKKWAAILCQFLVTKATA